MTSSDDDGVGPGLPGPRVAAALVLGVLAFGVVVGDAAGPGATAAGAGGRPNLTILVAAPPAPATAAVMPGLTATTPQPPDVEGDSTALDDVSVSDDSAMDDTSSVMSTDNAGDATDGSSADDDAPAADEAPEQPTPTPTPKLPPVNHVWLVALTGHSYDESFGAGSPAPYLATELRAKGTLLPWYHAAGHDPSAGGVALLGGQRDALGPFDDKTLTLADQLTGAGRTWKAYIEGATAGLNTGDNPCLRPPEQQPRNPFLRFAAIAGAADCGSSIADLGRIAPDAAGTGSAPAFSYILPGPAHDGSTSLADADAWLRVTLPAILDSKAYNDGGLVIVTFDAGAPTDVEAGGGRVGALLLSPFVTAGGTINAPYDPFSLLASIEGLFGLDPIGYAENTKLKPFGPKVYGAWSPATAAG